MFPFATVSGVTAGHLMLTPGDDWIEKVSDPVIAFKLHSPKSVCVINVMIIHMSAVTSENLQPFRLDRAT